MSRDQIRELENILRGLWLARGIGDEAYDARMEDLAVLSEQATS